MWAKLGLGNLLRTVRWMRWHCPPDTEFEIRALAIWGRARYLTVMEAPHNIEYVMSERERNMLFLCNLNARAGLEPAIFDLLQRWHNIETSLGKCLIFVGGGGGIASYRVSSVYPANRSRWPKVVLMLIQRWSQWANIKATLVQCVIFYGKWPSNHLILPPIFFSIF